MSTEKPKDARKIEKLDCFVIMPLSDPDGYGKGHFKHVFEDIFMPACDKAGFNAIRADQVKQTNLIHLDVLQKLVETPIALCDLSSRNPNVLFELGLRQAFDKPVVLVRENGTPDIFDIAPLRFTEYRRQMLYHEVLEDQSSIASAITETQEAFKKGKGINSVVKLLSLQPATLLEVPERDKDPLLQMIRAELSEIRSEFRTALKQINQERLYTFLHHNTEDEFKKKYEQIFRNPSIFLSYAHHDKDSPFSNIIEVFKEPAKPASSIATTEDSQDKEGKKT